MDTDIYNNGLVINDKFIPLLASEGGEIEIAVPYIFHSSFIYRFSQYDESHLLRRILTNGLIPEKRLCKDLIVNACKRKIDHPYHWRKLGKEFLKRHHCVMPDGTHKNCWLAYKEGVFGPNRRKIKLLSGLGEYLSCSLMACTCFYTCSALLGHGVSYLAFMIILCLTTISIIPFMNKIWEWMQDFKILFFPAVVMGTGAILEQLLSGNDYNLFITLWGTLGSIGTILCLGAGGLICVITAFMCLFDIFQDKYL